MVEVFKTNVKKDHEADMLLDLIHRQLKGYKANFDLEDHDSILRIKCPSGAVDAASVISILSGMGFTAEVLEDEFV